MLISAIHRGLLFGYVLMDSWYATADLMKLLISKHKVFYCPLKANRKVDDSNGQHPYQPVSSLSWSPTELAQGKLIKLHKFPLDAKPGRRSGEIVPGRGLHRPHGLDDNQRLDSRFCDCCSTGE